MPYNPDELVAPSWLNDEFFRDVMRQVNHDPTIELVSECALRPGTKLGEHYASVMFRTSIKYVSKKSNVEQSINVIMKTTPEADGIKKELLEDNKLFDTEIRMYSKILPEMARLLKGVGEEYKYPRYIYGALKPHSIVILEDISHQGWIMGDFIDTIDEMKPIIKNIAMFHAASVVMESKDSNFSTENYFSMADKLMSFDLLLNKGFDDLKYLTVTYPEFARFAKPLDHFRQDLRKVLESAYKPSRTFQNVLNHGDFQCKNMLHQIDRDGRHTDTILLDYQICCWTSPAIDLYSMFDIITTQELKNTCRNELIYLYHQEYSELLKRLGFEGNIPTLLEIQIELLRAAGLGMRLSKCLKGLQNH
ncbi:AGAP003762-PA-like protein [Anopheles sinensis]|uniref:AGAP003762-PA-like protein n=1 Tax=Anopheles sinensis TaxID=74873 RepID=A0A084VUK1_ANOSI|nr:AGAP003762-PA-like protein [Anopheles sinensis]